MPPVLAYQTARARIHRDDDGTLRIDVPPMGVAVALRRLYGKEASTLSWIIGLTCAALGFIGPPVAAGVIWFFNRDPTVLFFLIAAPFVEIFVLAILAGIFAHQGKQRAHLAISPTMFSIEQMGIGDNERLTVPREQVETVYVEVEHREATSQCLRIRCRGSKVDQGFLSHLSREELESIAQNIQQELGLHRTG